MIGYSKKLLVEWLRNDSLDNKICVAYGFNNVATYVERTDRKA